MDNTIMIVSKCNIIESMMAFHIGCNGDIRILTVLLLIVMHNILLLYMTYHFTEGVIRYLVME